MKGKAHLSASFYNCGGLNKQFRSSIIIAKKTQKTKKYSKTCNYNPSRLKNYGTRGNKQEQKQGFFTFLLNFSQHFNSLSSQYHIAHCPALCSSTSLKCTANNW